MAEKYLIASDIHGSALYCQKMLDAFEREDAEHMILLGDLLYHGPRNELPGGYDTKTVAQLLNPYKDKIYAVRGNCDAEVDQMVLEFPIQADYMLLKSGHLMMFATHGHLYNESQLPAMDAVDVLLHGHTHVACCRRHEGYTYINPGSVSLPKEGTKRGYILLEDGVFVWKDLDGNEYMRY